MSLIPFDVFPRSMFDYNSWLSPTFDVFDPFDELDNVLARNFQWLNRPSFLENLAPRFPRKYRVTIDCSGMKPESIKTNVENNKLTVTGKEESREESGDYSIREFKKTYELPENAEADKLASFITAFGQLIIEVPLKEPQQVQTGGFLTSGDLLPKVIDKDGGKAVNLKVSVPQNIDPSKLNVVSTLLLRIYKTMLSGFFKQTVKDRDVVIKAEDVQDKPDRYSRKYYYRRYTLPENTDFNTMKCKLENNQLFVEANINPELQKGPRQIQIEMPKSIQQGQQQQRTIQ